MQARERGIESGPFCKHLLCDCTVGRTGCRALQDAHDNDSSEVSCADISADVNGVSSMIGDNSMVMSL